MRTGDRADAGMVTWSSVVPVARRAPLNLQSRYIQYRAELAERRPESDAGARGRHASAARRVPPAPIITPVIAWAPPANITYGTLLSATQLNATVAPDVPGAFDYMPAAGTKLVAGTHTLSVTFTPTDTTAAASANGAATITVLKATPTISWPAPTAVTYGTALSATQLNATASVPGTFAYLPNAGTLLGGGAQTLAVAFTPTETANYNNANATVPITVQKATPVIAWATPAAIMSGTALGATQLNATANVAGTFAYNPASGTVLAAGTRVLSAAFTPANPANYNAASASVNITVTQGASTVVVSSSNTPSLFGVPITLTATVMPAVAGGTVKFLDGTATISCLTGSVLTGPVATCKTSALAIGTHLVKAVYTPSVSSGQPGATSAAFSQVVSPSATAAGQVQRLRPAGQHVETEGHDLPGEERPGEGVLDREFVRRQYLRGAEPEEVGHDFRRR